MATVSSELPLVHLSPARLARRAHMLDAARALIDSKSPADFDPVRSPINAIDLVIVAGSPWLAEGLVRDFIKDEAGYRKLGGGNNTPQAPYFVRSTTNLIHYLKRIQFYIPRGMKPEPLPGMACFLEWDDRGMYNYAPDRAGIILQTQQQMIKQIALPVANDPTNKKKGYTIKIVDVEIGSQLDRALIGYADLP